MPNQKSPAKKAHAADSIMRFFGLLALFTCAAAGTSNAGPGHWSALRKPQADGTPAAGRERVRGQLRELLVKALAPRFPEIP